MNESGQLSNMPSATRLCQRPSFSENSLLRILPRCPWSRDRADLSSVHLLEKSLSQEQEDTRAENTCTEVHRELRPLILGL